MAPRKKLPAKSAGGKAPRHPLAKKPKPKSIGNKNLRKPESTSGELLHTELKSPATNRSNQIHVLFKVAHAFAFEKYHSNLKPLYRSPKDSANLVVDPNTRIADLKLALRPQLWIPSYESFELASDNSNHAYVVYDDTSSLDQYEVKDQDIVFVLMEGYSLDLDWYRRFLHERGDYIYPLGEPIESVPPMVEPHIELEKVKIYFKLAHTLKPLEPAHIITPKQISSRDTVALMVHLKMPIGILKIMLRSRFWIPFNESFDLAHLHGPVLGADDRSTLLEFAVKEHDTLLVLMEAFPLDRTLLFQHGTLHFPLEEPKKMQIFIKSAQYLRQYWRYPERSEDNRHIVCLTVEPKLTIGALKSILKHYYWIPMKNLVLFAERNVTSKYSLRSNVRKLTIFGDDNSTLDTCCIKDGDMLMACMEDGSFTVRVYDYTTFSEFPIKVSSCFETIHDLKLKICKTQGHHLEDLVLTRPGDYVAVRDTTLLVSLGIAKPFMKLMEKQSACHLKLRTPKKKMNG